jgi:microcin C transport system permease protein
MAVPGFVNYPEEKFGGFLAGDGLSRPGHRQRRSRERLAVWPLIRYSYRTHNLDLPSAGAGPADLAAHRRAVQAGHCRAKGGTTCRDLEWNWLGTDDQGRDVVARLIYGFRISVLFGLILTIVSSVIGIAAGASRAISAAGPI